MPPDPQQDGTLSRTLPLVRPPKWRSYCYLFTEWPLDCSFSDRREPIEVAYLWTELIHLATNESSIFALDRKEVQNGSCTFRVLLGNVPLEMQLSTGVLAMRAIKLSDSWCNVTSHRPYGPRCTQRMESLEGFSISPFESLKALLFYTQFLGDFNCLIGSTALARSKVSCNAT